MPIQLEVKQYSQSWFSIRWQFISAINDLREVGAERFSVCIRSLLNVGCRESVSAESEKKPKKKSTKQVKTQNAEHNTPTYAQKDYETVHYLDLNGRQHL